MSSFKIYKSVIPKRQPTAISTALPSSSNQMQLSNATWTTPIVFQLLLDPAVCPRPRNQFTCPRHSITLNCIVSYLMLKKKIETKKTCNVGSRGVDGYVVGSLVVAWSGLVLRHVCIYRANQSGIICSESRQGKFDVKVRLLKHVIYRRVQRKMTQNMM